MNVLTTEPEEPEVYYYYAVLSTNDVVLWISPEPRPTNDSTLIPLDFNDESLIGKWYDRANSTPDNPIFTERPYWTIFNYLSDKVGVRGYNEGSLQDYIDNNIAEFKDNQFGIATGTYTGDGEDVQEFIFGNSGVISVFISRTDTNAMFMTVGNMPVTINGESNFIISEDGKMRVSGSLNEEGVIYCYTIFNKTA